MNGFAAGRTVRSVGLVAAMAASPLTLPAGMAHAALAQVVYEVEGSGVVDSISYSDGIVREGPGQGPKDEKVALPWKKTVSVASSGHLVVLVWAWGSPAPITCRISADGAVLVEKTQPSPVSCEADVRAG